MLLLLITLTRGFTAEYNGCEVVEEIANPTKTNTSHGYRISGNCWESSQSSRIVKYKLSYTEAVVTVKVPNGGCLAPFTDLTSERCIRYDIRRHPKVADAFIEVQINEDSCPKTSSSLMSLINDTIARDGTVCENGGKKLTASTSVSEIGKAQRWYKDFMLLGHSERSTVCYAKNCIFDDGIEIDVAWNRSNEITAFQLLLQSNSTTVNESYTFIKSLDQNYSIYGNKDTGNSKNLFNDVSIAWPYNNISQIANDLSTLSVDRPSIVNQCSIVANGSCVVLGSEKSKSTNTGTDGGYVDCVSEKYLTTMGLSCRYHDESRMREVLCNDVVCATRNHVMIWDSTPLPMWKICENVDCVTKFEVVNQPCLLEWIELHGALYDNNGVSIMSGGDVFSRVLASNLLLVHMAGFLLRMFVALRQTLPVLGIAVVVLVSSRHRR